MSRAGVAARLRAAGSVFAEDEAGLLIAEAEGLDLARSYGYGDSAADLPWLALVGTPTAVNPDARLAREALRRRWRIVEWRRGGVTRAALPRA